MTSPTELLPTKDFESWVLAYADLLTAEARFKRMAEIAERRFAQQREELERQHPVVLEYARAFVTAAKARRKTAPKSWEIAFDIESELGLKVPTAARVKLRTLPGRVEVNDSEKFSAWCDATGNELRGYTLTSEELTKDDYVQLVAKLPVDVLIKVRTHMNAKLTAIKKHFEQTGEIPDGVTIHEKREVVKVDPLFGTKAIEEQDEDKEEEAALT